MRQTGRHGLQRIQALVVHQADAFLDVALFGEVAGEADEDVALASCGFLKR